MLASVLRQAGYRTGLFTSPHLCRVEERVQVDGQPIVAEELTAILNDVAEVVNREQTLAPTFFEVATALGFLHFVRRRVDVAIIEVGLGGRFDSTNVCRPELAIITSISFDHMRQLGNRLESIAFEKAGIVKPGTIAISGATAPEARQVIERICRERGAPLQELGSDFFCDYEPGRLAGAAGLGNGHVGSVSNPIIQRPRVRVRTRRRNWPEMELGLLGRHQAANAAVAIACIEALREAGWRLPDKAVAAGLAQVSWAARQEIVSQRPWILLDCAHNVASMQALVETLNAYFPNTRRYLVFASSNDKDVAGMFRAIDGAFTHAFLTRYGHNPRSVPAENLEELLQCNSGISSTICPSAAEALAAARRMAAPDDLICITGSVFLAGELRPILVGDH
jgi:dihydrofolate synthase/folylpolyglutamate synthase